MSISFGPIAIKFVCTAAAHAHTHAHTHALSQAEQTLPISAVAA